MKNLVAVLALILAWTPAGAGQGIPNFSGTWSLDRSLSEPSGTGPAVELIIAHKGNELAIERRAQQSFEVKYALDSGGSLNRLPTGEQMVTRSRWQGAQLLIEGTRTLRDGRQAQTSDAYTLDPEGTLTIVRTVNMTTSVFTSREVFVKH